ncbi:MAG: cation:proton antiporter [Erysipelotrichaceae bacterium]|nr:cation:proton antiporter [Erysipelotrichaceae bacterium]
MNYYEILLPLALVLFLSKIFGKIANRFNLPSVIGMLLAGLLVGLIQYIPSQTILTDSVKVGFGFLAKIGVILILFSAGLETDLKKIKSVGKSALIITLGGVLLPLALGFLVATLFNGGFNSLSQDRILQNLFYGTILTATSVSVSVATLKEMNKLDSKVGTSIITAAIIDDLLGIIILSFILALKGSSGVGEVTTSPLIVILKTLLYFVAVSIIAFLASKLFVWLDKKFPHHRLIPIFGLSLCFIVSYISEKYFGVADITGAYIVGLILSTNNESKYIDRKTDILSYMIFVPIFFGNIGISTKFSAFNSTILLFGICFVLAGIIGKVVGCGGIAFALKYNLKDSLKIGVGMMARAEVALVTTQKGIEYGLVDDSIMSFVIILIIVSSLLTPLILQRLYKKEISN